MGNLLESTNTAPRSPHRSPTQLPASDTPSLPLFFFLFTTICADSGQNGSISIETGTKMATETCRYGHRNRLIRPIPVKTAAEMSNGCHSFASCGLVRGKKKKKKKEEDEKTQKNGCKKNKGM